MKRKKGITAKDIAALVGCCQQAVSAVVTGRGNSAVSAEKREKIISIARQFNYRLPPSLLKAPSVALRRIGIIMEGGLESFNSQVVNALSQKLLADGYDAFCIPMVNPASEKKVICDLVAGGACGIISLFTRGELIQEKLPIPSVLIGYDNHDLDVDWHAAFRLATEHLIDHGRQRIGFIQSQPGRSNQLAYNGYCEAISNADLEFSKDWCISLGWNADYEKELLSLLKEKKIDALLCRNDLIAARLLVWLRQHNFQVPDDVAVMGCGGWTFGEAFSTSLSSIVYPVNALATQAVKLLQEKIENKIVGRTAPPVLVKPVLHAGHSCGCPEQKLEIIWWEGIPDSFDQEKWFEMQLPPFQGHENSD